MKPTLLILAAGMGSRYGGLKQIDGIGPAGEAIIEFSIYDAIRAGFGKVVFVIREDIEAAFKAKFAGKFEDQIELRYAFQAVDTPVEGIESFPERVKPWGTAHAVLVAEHEINEPFAVINADDYYGVGAFQKMADFLTGACNEKHYSMIGYVIGKTLSDNGSVSRGVAQMDANNFMTDVVERTKVERIDGTIYYQDDAGEKHPLSDDNLVSMNFWGFHPNIFDVLRSDFAGFVKENGDQPKAEFFIPLVTNRLIQEGAIQLSVIANDEKWYGVTYKEDKEPVQNAFAGLTKAGTYPTPLW